MLLPYIVETICWDATAQGWQAENSASWVRTKFTRKPFIGEELGSHPVSASRTHLEDAHVSSVQFSHSVVSDSLQPHELQHARPPCPSPTPRAHPNSCPSTQWCHPTISSSVISFSSCLQSFPASGSFPRTQFFASCGQSIEASASVLPMNIQDWFPLGRTG